MLHVIQEIWNSTQTLNIHFVCACSSVTLLNNTRVLIERSICRSIILPQTKNKTLAPLLNPSLWSHWGKGLFYIQHASLDNVLLRRLASWNSKQSADKWHVFCFDWTANVDDTNSHLCIWDCRCLLSLCTHTHTQTHNTHNTHKTHTQHTRTHNTLLTRSTPWFLLLAFTERRRLPGVTLTLNLLWACPGTPLPTHTHR